MGHIRDTAVGGQVMPESRLDVLCRAWPAINAIAFVVFSAIWTSLDRMRLWDLIAIQRELIFRITHISNVPWILKHEGMDCRNSHLQDPSFVRIGNAELIDKRANRPVPIGPGGMLNDYVPFYFTPFSIMMYQIHTGYGGIQRRENHEIVIFVSSVHRLVQQKVPFVFTNQHAYSVDTDFFDSVEHLDRIDWQLLKKKDFQRDLNDPGKTLRYQAETLVHRRVPLLAFFGIGCFNQAVKDELDEQLASTNAQIAVKVTPSWYY